MAKTKKSKQAISTKPPTLIPLTSAFLDLTDYLGSNSTFLATLTYYNPPEVMNEHVRSAAAAVSYHFTTPKSSERAFNVVQSMLGKGAIPPERTPTQHLKSCLQVYISIVKQVHERRRMLARRCGLFQQRGPQDVGFPLGVKVKQLQRLAPKSIYPPPQHKILERPYSIDEFAALKRRKTKVNDKSCTDSNLYHVLNETKLQYTVEPDESVVLMDGEKIVAIVIRHFVMDEDCFKQMEEWCAELILSSLERRRACLRNFPHIAHVGVTTGARSCPLFGWARNLYAKYLGTDDTIIQEHHLSSLFGFFYAMLRGHCPAVANIYEDTIKKSDGLPRLDKHNTSEFHLPCPDSPSFRGYPMSPPEGYIASNFSRPIHTDRHWEGCPLAVYWNIRRRQCTGLTGKESGASFFIAEYGVRVINASNTGVIWDVSLNHGTGVYENDLEHVGVAILMSREIESSWEAYKAKIEKGEVSSKGLFWPEDYYFSDEEKEEIDEEVKVEAKLVSSPTIVKGRRQTRNSGCHDFCSIP